MIVGTVAEHASILNYVRSLRLMARDDKRLSREAFNERWRAYAAAERRRRIKEAWLWRGIERRLRGHDSASTIVARARRAERMRIQEQLKAQLEASVEMGG